MSIFVLLSFQAVYTQRRVIPCQVIRRYISDHEQNPRNFISREMLSISFSEFKLHQYS